MSIMLTQIRRAVEEAEKIESRLDLLHKIDPQSAEISPLMEMTSFRWEEDKGLAFFNGRITQYTVTSARKMLRDMAERDSFKLYINSIGGTAVAGIALYNLFRDADVKIEAIVIGEAYSSASLMVQGADTRLVSPGASIGVHRAWAGMIGNAEEFLQAAEDLERTDKRAMEIYTQRVPENNVDMLKKHINRDVALSGEESIEIGLADGVFKAKPPKEMNEKLESQPPTEEEVAEAVIATPDKKEEVKQEVKETKAQLWNPADDGICLEI